MFSVIVSIYKVEKFLRQCIDSILNQTYGDFELILIDDGSPDFCPMICDEYAALDNRIRVIHKKNGGLISTRKIGVSEARGQYICFVDGDDFIRFDMLETFAMVLKDKKVDIICSEFVSYTNDSEQIKRSTQQIPYGVYDKTMLENSVYQRMISSRPFYSFYVMPSVCTKCFKCEIAKRIYKNIPENISIGEDAAATYPALMYANSIAVIDYYGYYYRQNQASMTHTYDRRLFEKVKNLLEYLKAIASELECDLEKQLDEYAVYLLMLAKNNELVYNCDDTYRDKRKNMLMYLQENIFEEAIKHANVDGIKNVFLLWCFKHKAIMLLYICSKKDR